MEIAKKAALFCIGGGAYVGLELLWRGRSHGTMFVLGGLCFLLIGNLGQVEPKLPLVARMLLGSLICTAGELLFGMLFNADYRIWDYRAQPYTLGGQVCLTFSVLWIGLSGVAIWLYARCDRFLSRPQGGS